MGVAASRSAVSHNRCVSTQPEVAWLCAIVARLGDEPGALSFPSVAYAAADATKRTAKLTSPSHGAAPASGRATSSGFQTGADAASR